MSVESDTRDTIPDAAAGIPGDEFLAALAAIRADLRTRGVQIDADAWLRERDEAEDHG